MGKALLIIKLEIDHFRKKTYLPWQFSAAHFGQNVADALNVVPSAELDSQMRVQACILGCSDQVLALSMRNVYETSVLTVSETTI